MKFPPLFSSLAVIALAGSAAFVCFLTPSCDLQETGHAEAKTAGQHRAFASALPGQDREEQSRGLPDAARAQADRSAAFAEAARVRAAQRDFWFRHLADRSDVPEMQQKAVEYKLRRFWWAEYHVTGRMGTSPSGSVKTALQSVRQELDRQCEDLTLLTPQARAEWDAWNAKDWADYQLPPLHAGKVEIVSPPELAEAFRKRKAETAEFESRSNRTARALVDEMEYLEDLASLPDEPSPPGGAARIAVEEEARVVLEKLAALRRKRQEFAAKRSR